MTRPIAGAVIVAVMLAGCGAGYPTPACAVLSQGYATFDGREVVVRSVRLKGAYIENKDISSLYVPCERIKQTRGVE